MNILLADDEMTTAISVSFVLRHSGHQVDIVDDGDEALETLRQNPGRYQILMTDHHMRKLTGLELIQQIRKTDFCGKIIVLSAYLTHELEKSYRALGAETFVSKPFEIPDLRKLVEFFALSLPASGLS